MTHLSTEGTQRVTRKVPALSWKVDESKPLDVGEDEPRQICSGLVPYMAAEVGLRGLHSFTLELNLSTFGTR
jgi:hypothetical protein